MRTTLLVSSILGGAVSLLAVLSTHAHPVPGSELTGDSPRPLDVAPGAERAPSDESVLAPPWIAERPVDVPGRARTVERVEVQTGRPTRKNGLAELGGELDPAPPDPVGAVRSVGRLEALDHPRRHGGPHGGHPGDRAERRHRHDAREDRLVDPPLGQLGDQVQVLGRLEEELGDGEVGQGHLLGQAVPVDAQVRRGRVARRVRRHPNGEPADGPGQLDQLYRVGELPRRVGAGHHVAAQGEDVLHPGTAQRDQDLGQLEAGVGDAHEVRHRDEGGGVQHPGDQVLGALA